MSRLSASLGRTMSLRPPQRESLDRLAEIMDRLVPEGPGAQLARRASMPTRDVALDQIHGLYPEVTDFEREFPSLAFALATGVGKTRLMGAFIALLKQDYGVRNFLVLAPNLTIYEKLKADFQPGNPKYVFQGVADFGSSPPEVITGDDYDSGKSLLRAYEGAVHVNVFNIAKMAEKVAGARGLRIKALSEYIGTSYFDFLAAQDDLVVIMDESHRYRAAGSMSAINELKPILGLELTATPKLPGQNGAPFRNVVYSYPLGQAMRDGFVKVPAVVTRENFRAEDYDTDPRNRLNLEGGLDRLKLEDGVHVHEATKVKLAVYAGNQGLPPVKPFILVVTRSIEEAGSVERLVNSEEFFQGRYMNRVISVHSGNQGQLKDDVLARLLKVESPDERTEIVIHVNKLGEGWDVTNLYTIVPLRSLASDILTEQTIGRGLRLPYGKRTGVPEIDTLNLIAHEAFDKVVNAAKDETSLINWGTKVLTDDIEVERTAVTVSSRFASAVAGKTRVAGDIRPDLVLTTPEEQTVAEVTARVIGQYSYLASSAELRNPEIRQRLVAEVREAVAAYQAQASLEGTYEAPDVEAILDRTVEAFIELTIDVPKITVTPKTVPACGFKDFDLDTSAIHFQPLAGDILIQGLLGDDRRSLGVATPNGSEDRLENHLVSILIDADEVDYEQHSDLLYKLAGQAVDHLASYLVTEDEVALVVQQKRRAIGELILGQLRSHAWEEEVDYDVKVVEGFTEFRSISFEADKTASALDFRNRPPDLTKIRSYHFGRFQKCLYALQQFHSDPERRFAVVLENDAACLKWVKPGPNQLPIYLPGEGRYEPDFLVEASDCKYLVEVKRDDLVGDPAVLAKAKAAIVWCRHATEHAKTHGGKPWRYLLLKDSSINLASTLAGLAGASTV